MVAAQQGDMRRVAHLVSHDKHPVAVSNAYGMTPLHYAVMRADIPMVKFLVGEGADIHAENNLRQSPWSLARGEPKKETVERLCKAMEEGKVRSDAEALKARIAAETGELRARQEGYLVRELRTITKGTSAALAVQLALKADSSGGNDFKRMPGAPSLGLSLAGAPRNKEVQSALDSTARATAAAARRASGGGMAAALQLHSPRDFSHSVLPRTISSVDKRAAEQSLSSMPVMWTRHVLNYLAANKARAKVQDAALTVKLGATLDMRNAERRRQMAAGRGGGGPGGGTTERLGVLTVRQDAADTDYRRALEAPEQIDEHKLRSEPVPDADSRRFESWVRMRGLS